MKRKDLLGQNKPVQHQGQEEFLKRFHDDLKDLKTEGRVIRYNEEPTEGTQEDPQAPGPKGIDLRFTKHRRERSTQVQFSLKTKSIIGKQNK